MTPLHAEGMEGRMCEHTPCTKAIGWNVKYYHTERGWGDGVKNSRAKLEWARQEKPAVQRDWGDSKNIIPQIWRVVSMHEHLPAQSGSAIMTYSLPNS